MQNLIERDGLKGMTSNPSIFEKAMGHGDDYDAGFKELAAKGDARRADASTRRLAIQDIQHAADLLRPVYDATEQAWTATSAWKSRPIWRCAPRTRSPRRAGCGSWSDRANLMVKVPGTEPGHARDQTLIGEGMNINVTLLFSQRGLQGRGRGVSSPGWKRCKAKGGDVSRVASVASFFVSRIDSQIDKKIDERVKAGGADVDDAEALRGKVAIANAKLAYQHYLELIGSERWKALAAAGAHAAAPAVGQHRREGQGLSRHAVCRGADRPRHGQHHAAGDDGRVPRPRHGKRSADRGRRRREAGPGRRPSGSASIWTASPRRWSRTASSSSPRPPTTCWARWRPSARRCWATRWPA